MNDWDNRHHDVKNEEGFEPVFTHAADPDNEFDMPTPTYRIELTIEQVGMIQLALRLAALDSRTLANGTTKESLDLIHLRTHIAESVSYGSQNEQSGSKTSTP